MESDLSTLILVTVGAVIQLVFKYLPKLSVWYAAQSNKALIMVVVVAFVSLIYFGLGCTPLAPMFGITLTCDVKGAVELLLAFVYILGSQQTTYLLTRKG